MTGLERRSGLIPWNPTALLPLTYTHSSQSILMCVTLGNLPIDAEVGWASRDPYCQVINGKWGPTEGRLMPSIMPLWVEAVLLSPRPTLSPPSRPRYWPLKGQRTSLTIGLGICVCRGETERTYRENPPRLPFLHLRALFPPLPLETTF